MSDYEEKKAARVERFRQRAVAAEREATARFNSQNVETLRGLNGQPILVGHHSEKRHRALIARADNDMRKACEATDKAKHYREKAEAAEKNQAISGDDPDALDKLQEKLDDLEAFQERLRADNKALRKARIKPEGSDPAGAMREAGLSERSIKSLMDLARVCRYQCEPYMKHPTYELSNNNANIKRVRQRIAELEAQAEQGAAPPQEHDGFAISEDTDWGRILCTFDAKPPKAVCRQMRRYGWRWAPSAGAWVRHLNAAGRNAATLLVELLPALLSA